MAFSYESLLGFYQQRKQLLIGILVAILLVVIGFYYYFYQYKPPIEQKAYERLSFAEEYFRLDSLDIALSGRGSNMGLLGIIKEYSNTPAGNLAHYYAGIIFLRKHKFQLALEHLRAFKPNSALLKSRTHSLLGDVYGELKSAKEAYDEYLKAVEYATGDKEFIAECLFRAGRIMENNDLDKAINNYKQIKNAYPSTQRAKYIDKYISKLEN